MADAEKDTRTPAEVEADLALKQADLTLKTLEAEKHRAEIRKVLAEAVKAESEATAWTIDLAKKEEARQVEKAADYYHRVYQFVGQVSEASVDKCVDRLTTWTRIDPRCDIEVVFNSPGGSVIDGMALYDFLQQLRRDGHRITTTGMGIAASMAGILLQAGDVRRMGREAWVLIHEGSFGVQGSIGQVEDRFEWVKRIQDRILDIFAERAKASAAEKPATRAFIKRNWERKDWWLSSDECLKLGIVDEVL